MQPAAFSFPTFSSKGTGRRADRTEPLRPKERKLLAGVLHFGRRQIPNNAVPLNLVHNDFIGYPSAC